MGRKLGSKEDVKSGTQGHDEGEEMVLEEREVRPQRNFESEIIIEGLLCGKEGSRRAVLTRSGHQPSVGLGTVRSRDL